ncbi:MAG: hypothetical protein MSG64_16800 [Pyrinomonadaceae bacterium MAG19_C2-C3]|nr:hypothetical protein [Pyrinomonadaceae bacterium MAG19_C2-C3]
MTGTTITLPHDKYMGGLHKIFCAIGGEYARQGHPSGLFWLVGYTFPDTATADRARQIMAEYVEAFNNKYDTTAHWRVQDRYERELGIVRHVVRTSVQLWEGCDTCGGNPCYCFDDAPLTASGEIYGGAE